MSSSGLKKVKTLISALHLAKPYFNFSNLRKKLEIRFGGLKSTSISLFLFYQVFLDSNCLFATPSSIIATVDTIKISVKI